MARRARGCYVRARRRRLLQTGRTSLRVSLSQTNGLRLFGAVFHRNLLFIIPPAPGWYRAVFARSSVNVVNSTTGLGATPTTGCRQTLKTSSSFLPPVPLWTVRARENFVSSPFFFISLRQSLQSIAIKMFDPRAKEDCIITERRYEIARHRP